MQRNRNGQGILRQRDNGGLASLLAQMEKESACNAGDLGSTPGLERSPREEKGNLLRIHA